MSSRARRVWVTMSESFWAFLLGIIVLFVFLLALGTFSPGEAIGVTVAMAALTLLWIAHAVWASRQAPQRDPRAVAARERRGF